MGSQNIQGLRIFKGEKKNQEGGLLQSILGVGYCAEWWPSLHDSDPDHGLEMETFLSCPSKGLETRRSSWKKGRWASRGMSMGHNCSG